MSWEKEVEEIKRRHELAERMGGDDGIARQRQRGKLTIRERIDLMVDEDSFQQMGKLAGHASYDEQNQLADFVPSSSITGLCRINGRRVYLTGQDFTVRGGSGAASSSGIDAGHNHPSPLTLRLPTVNLIDGSGGSVTGFEQLGRTYIPDGAFFGPLSEILTVAPVASAILGPAAGGLAPMPCLSHFSVMVKGIGQVFPGGPPVVKAALNRDMDKNELGGYQIHTRISGVVNNAADTEREAFEQIRSFLSYLPDNVWELPPRTEPTDDPKRKDERLLSIVPRNKRQRYDPYVILQGVFDEGSFFEISPDFGKSRITGLARSDGYAVGVMINNCMHLGGSMDVDAAEKSIRLIQLCDTFHLPLVFLMDEPGFYVGLESEKRAIERAGTRLVYATVMSKMPMISVIIRQAYGLAGSLQYRPGRGLYRRYAWPSGHWGSIHIEGGTSAAYRRVIEAAEDPEAKRKELEERLQAYASPFRTAEAIGLDLIDPRDTRSLVCEFVETAQGVIKTQLGPGSGPTYWP
jgi:acetyl-CoA carboxylase carboxyltransferase component|tara:strand:+ start:30851 stop:32410 length:1560 start_codon:yes stop_codon:yes gene_type:complete